MSRGSGGQYCEGDNLMSVCAMAKFYNLLEFSKKVGLGITVT